jgi:hypothetical protein
MKKQIIALGVVLCAALFAVPAQSQIKKLAQTGLQFLKIDVSPRAAAMGGAYTMAGNDASALFYNPAGTARMESSADLFVSQTQWIADIDYFAAAFAKDMGNWGTFGASLLFADYGDDMIGAQVANNERGYDLTGTVDIGAYAIGLAYSKALTDKFAIGGQVKYAYQQLGSNVLVAGGNPVKNDVGGFAFDFGTIFYPGFESLQIGMSVNNFSGQYTYEDEPFQLPLTFKISAALNVMDLGFMGEHSNPLLLSVDALHPRDYTERVHLGAEYVFSDIVALRAGYKFNYDEESFSAGLGLRKSFGQMKVKLDYAYSQLDIFDSVNRVSLGIAF